VVVGTERYIQTKYQDDVASASEVAANEIAVTCGDAIDDKDVVNDEVITVGKDAAFIKNPHLSISLADGKLLEKDNDENIQLRRGHSALL